MKSWTGERLEPFIYTRDTIDHLHRYALTSIFIENKIVLDIASGEGYGSNLLSQKAKFVYGVDIDIDTIKKAQKNYIKENLKFIQGSTSAIPLENAIVDVVISFETIEHHEEHQKMMSEIKRVLKPNGILIISTPDKMNYSDKRNFSNQFHIKELYKNEFTGLLLNNFKHLQLFTQQYINGNSIILDGKNQTKTSFYIGDYSKIEQVDSFPLYLIAIVSDFFFQEQNDSFFDGSKILKSNIDDYTKAVYNSNTYRLGHFILRPFKYIKKVLK